MALTIAEVHLGAPRGLLGELAAFYGDALGLDVDGPGPEGLAVRAGEATLRFAEAPEGGAEEMGTGLYGPSLFYRGRGAFHVGRVCNRWTADLLDAAGLPTAPLAAILPAGLIADLRWRARLRLAEAGSP